MIPGRIGQATRYLGAPEGWEPPKDGACAHLAIRDVQTGPGDRWAMLSAWEPTPDELKRLMAGALVHLLVSGKVHPPVAIGVGEPPEGASEEEAPAPEPLDEETLAYQQHAMAMDAGVTALMANAQGRGMDMRAAASGALFAIVRVHMGLMTPPITVRDVLRVMIPAINRAATELLEQS